MDIVITLPSNINWEDYQKELNNVKNGKSVLNFKVNNFPKLSKVGDKCYLNYKNNIIGWMYITGLSEKEFICDITGKKWQGKFIERSGPFHTINPIPMKGFQGFRYFNLSENFINNFNDYIKESIRDKMKPKSEEEINDACIKILNNHNNPISDYEDNYIDEVSQILKEPKKKLHILTPQDYDDNYELLYNFLESFIINDDNFIRTKNIKNMNYSSSFYYQNFEDVYWVCYPKHKIACLMYDNNKDVQEWIFCKDTITKMNESLRDKMKPKSEEELLNYMEKLTKEELDLLLVKFVLEQQIPLIKIALQMGANPNTIDPKTNLTILYRAVVGGITSNPNKEIIKILLDAGADPMLPSKKGLVPLNYVKIWKKWDLYELLKQYVKTNESLRDKMIPKKGSMDKLNDAIDELVKYFLKDNYFDNIQEAKEFLKTDDILDRLSDMLALSMRLDEIYIELSQFYLDEYLYNNKLPLKFAYNKKWKDNEEIIGSDAYLRSHNLYYYETEESRKKKEEIKKSIKNFGSV